MTLEERLCDLVTRSLSKRGLREEISFPLPDKTVKIAWKYYFIDLRGYFCNVHSNDIRHVQKEHPDDVLHICKIPEYLESIAKLERSSSRDRETGRDAPCLVFTKKIASKRIQIVKLNLSRNKVLKLKTMFEA